MFYVDETLCAGCGACVEACPTGAIRLLDGYAVIRQELCNGCAVCVEECPNGAILETSEPAPVREVTPVRSRPAGQGVPGRGQTQVSRQLPAAGWSGWLAAVAPLALDLVAGFAGRGGRGGRGRAGGPGGGRGRGGCGRRS